MKIDEMGFTKWLWPILPAEWAMCLIPVELTFAYWIWPRISPGGVYEDPATGAAAAALGGYLRNIGWPGKNEFTILQGEDMGMPSRLRVKYGSNPGEGVVISGEVRSIEE